MQSEADLCHNYFNITSIITGSAITVSFDSVHLQAASLLTHHTSKEQDDPGSLVEHIKQRYLKPKFDSFGPQTLSAATKILTKDSPFKLTKHDGATNKT
jgi:hypothetical protein